MHTIGKCGQTSEKGVFSVTAGRIFSLHLSYEFSCGNASNEGNFRPVLMISCSPHQYLWLFTGFFRCCFSTSLSFAVSTVSVSVLICNAGCVGRGSEGGKAEREGVC